MAPPHTPRKKKTSKTTRREGDTVRRTTFFKAVDSRGVKPLELVYKEENIPPRTGRYWLQQRRQTPEIAYRRVGAFRTGRPFKISDQKLDQLLDLKNEVRDQCYEHQIEIHQLGCSVRCLQTSLRQRRRNAKLYSKAKVKWVSPRNKDIRQDYGHDHGDEDVEHFWAFVGWTDEAHVDPTAMGAGHVLREEGTRYDSENVTEIPPLQGVVLHMSAFVSYWYKGDLTFYNDPDDIPELDVNVQIDAPKKKRPPKQRKSETLEQFQQSDRYLEYVAAEPHDVDIQPKGNSMTQLYYVKKILPKHFKDLQEAERKTGRKHILQEDNDPSHGTRSSLNYAQLFRERYGIQSLHHPGQSPDLNPMEAVWNILKQRVREKPWKTKEDLKRVLLEAWDDIDQKEIQARIDEMPERCAWLVNNGGKGIKSGLW